MEKTRLIVDMLGINRLVNQQGTIGKTNQADLQFLFLKCRHYEKLERKNLRFDLSINENASLIFLK